jgi:phosphomevalonate kinase
MSPTILAPGRVLLVGEFSDAEDGCAVVAAITRYARAQVGPRADVMSGVVAEVMRQAQVTPGEILTALPTCSVSTTVDDLHENGRLSGLGWGAAAAVATAGALLETLGLPIDSRKSLVLATAREGFRASSGRTGSDADLLASTYGGLVQICRTKEAAPQALPIDCPAELHLVLFSARSSVRPLQVLEGIQRYATANRAGFDARNRVLRDCSQRFVKEISKGCTTGALWAAGRYTDELASLGTAAKVPVANELFTLASGLARHLGGVAKPTGAGNGNLGVAMFASREAADHFRKAAAEHLMVLDGDLDRLGVRRQDSSSELDEGPTQVESLTVPPSDRNPTAAVWKSSTGGTIESAVDDIDTTPRAIAPVQARAKATQRARRLILSALVIGAAAVLGAAPTKFIGSHLRAHPVSASHDLSAFMHSAAWSPEEPPSPPDPPPSEPVSPAGRPPARTDASVATKGHENDQSAVTQPEPKRGTRRRKSRTVHSVAHEEQKTEAWRARKGAFQVAPPRAGTLSPDEF